MMHININLTAHIEYSKTYVAYKRQTADRSMGDRRIGEILMMDINIRLIWSIPKRM